MTKPIGLGAAFAVGLIYPLFFFSFNDPDRVKFSAVVLWFFAILIPASLLVRVKSNKTSISSAVTVLAGVFVGTCVSIIVFYTDRATLFPIAAAIWTIVAIKRFLQSRACRREPSRIPKFSQSTKAAAKGSAFLPTRASAVYSSNGFESRGSAPGFRCTILPKEWGCLQSAARCLINESHLGYATYGSYGIEENIGASMSGVTTPAIFNATGKWVLDCPTTPDRVLKALGTI